MDPVDALLGHAGANGRRLAVQDARGSVEYADFVDLALRYGAAIAAFGDHPRILILLPRDRDAYASMFGAMMAGGYYAPGNLEAPPAKTLSLIEEFEPEVICTTPELARNYGLETRKIPLVFPGTLPAGGLQRPRKPHDLAYVIFTSGSTGVPKGVMIPRPALAHYISWIVAALSPTPDDRWSQHPNLAFDLSVFDIYGALCTGGALFPLDGRLDRLMPAKAVRRHNLTIWCSVPSVISLMNQAGQVTRENLGSVRAFNFCGEPLLEQQVRALFDAVPDAVVQNTYGPTEATVSCTEVKLTPANLEQNLRTNIAIGDAIPGMNLRLIGGDAPEAGEIVITGPQLAAGYWRNREATDRQFRNVTIDGVQTRGYFTGDWAKRIDGKIFFRSRIDFQVKFRGRRLELEEVDAALRKCGFENSVTLLHEDDLHSFVETADAEIDRPALRERLANYLESFAIPAHIHALPQLPRNANDKIDVSALLRTLRHGSDGRTD